MTKVDKHLKGKAKFHKYMSTNIDRRTESGPGFDSRWRLNIFNSVLDRD